MIAEKQKKKTFILIALGSNIGERKKNIKSAIDLLLLSGAIKKIESASLYETEPVGYLEQDWFLNTVISGYTNLPVYSLLGIFKTIEYIIGRKSRAKNREREIDLDLLLYGNQKVELEQITVPHPRMHERKFVLVPASEIAGSMIHPVFRKTLQQLLDECPDKSEVIKVESK